MASQKVPKFDFHPYLSQIVLAEVGGGAKLDPPGP